jgi:hypothetical protein
VICNGAENPSRAITPLLLHVVCRLGADEGPAAGAAGAAGSAAEAVEHIFEDAEVRKKTDWVSAELLAAPCG